ncbi:hypothetical protein CPIN17260_1677 [Campylobacter pinnipediorum subsp. pinnipediorum]|nr:hypothetical protein CPIN17260_1677 [Campylobacter pinnipediorum subsp. pinnipediorum]
MVDTRDLKSLGNFSVPVQVRLWAPPILLKNIYKKYRNQILYHQNKKQTLKPNN